MRPATKTAIEKALEDRRGAMKRVDDMITASQASLKNQQDERATIAKFIEELEADLREAGDGR